MKFRCSIWHSGPSDQGNFRITLDAESRDLAVAEATRICRLAFPGDIILGAEALVSGTSRPRRHDYEVQVRYVPTQREQVRLYSWSNCASAEEAEVAAERQFRLDHPGDKFILAEARQR